MQGWGYAVQCVCVSSSRTSRCQCVHMLLQFQMAELCNKHITTEGPGAKRWSANTSTKSKVHIVAQPSQNSQLSDNGATVVNSMPTPATLGGCPQRLMNWQLVTRQGLEGVPEYPKISALRHRDAAEVLRHVQPLLLVRVQSLQGLLQPPSPQSQDAAVLHV